MIPIIKGVSVSQFIYTLQPAKCPCFSNMVEGQRYGQGVPSAVVGWREVESFSHYIHYIYIYIVLYEYIILYIYIHVYVYLYCRYGVFMCPVPFFSTSQLSPWLGVEWIIKLCKKWMAQGTAVQCSSECNHDFTHIICMCIHHIFDLSKTIDKIGGTLNFDGLSSVLPLDHNFWDISYLHLFIDTSTHTYYYFVYDIPFTPLHYFLHCSSLHCMTFF